MSISMTKADGVTVLTLSSDPKSPWPPICQIFKVLCYNPVCCSVSQHLRRQRRISQSVLGTLNIMIGLLNIGLGTILLCSPVYMWVLSSTGCPIWLGILFILFGITGILSDKYPSPCVISLNVALNLAGVCFAITGIVLYSCTMASLYMWWDCSPEQRWYNFRTTQSPSPEELRIREACMEGKRLILILLRSIQGVMIVLSALGLCVTISSAVLGIKALKQKDTEDIKTGAEAEHYKPLLEDDAASSPA